MIFEIITACRNGEALWKTESFTATVTLPLTGILQLRTTDGVTDPTVVSWSIATRVVDVGTNDFLPRTAVETAHPGSPNGTFALSSQERNTHLSFSSTARFRKYLNCALQK